MGEGEGRQAGEMVQLVKHHARKPKVVPLPSTDLGWGDCCGHPGVGCWCTLGGGCCGHSGVGE